MAARVCQIVTLLLIAMSCGAPPCTAADQENDPAAPVFLDQEYSLGYQYYTVSGYRGRVGEYEVLDTGARADVHLVGRARGNSLQAFGRVRDEDDLSFATMLDLQRVLHTDVTYRRFRHALDHDPLDNQDFAIDADPDKTNGITIELFSAENELLLPRLPFLTLTADYRRLSRRGHRQATTVVKCAQCHVRSRRRRIDQVTDDVRMGMKADLGRAVLQYDYTWSSFREQASAPEADYGHGSAAFHAGGTASYCRAPDSRAHRHRLSLSADLPFSAALLADLHWGRRRNRDTGGEVGFTSLSARLSKYLLRFVRCEVFYNRYDLDSDERGGIEREQERGGLDVHLRPHARLALTGTWQWEHVDRRNVSETRTEENLYRLTCNYRFSPNLRLHAAWQRRRTHDPFVARDRLFLSLQRTVFCSAEDEGRLTLHWMPAPTLSVDALLRYRRGDNQRYDVEERSTEAMLSLWWMPVERATLGAALSMIDNRVKAPVALKTYHALEPGAYIFYDSVPYDDRSLSAALNATCRVTPRLSLRCGLRYWRSRADFDMLIGLRNAGKLSDLTIDRREMSAGFSLLCTPRLSLHGSFMFRDYDDRNDNRLDGRFRMISLAMNWSFAAGSGKL